MVTAHPRASHDSSSAPWAVGLGVVVPHAMEPRRSASAFTADAVIGSTPVSRAAGTSGDSAAGGLGFLRRLRAPWLRDEARPPLIREIGPRPFQHHDDAVPEADQEEDVDEDPEQPGDEPAEMEPADVGHRLPPSDDGELALVPITEGLARLSGEVSPNRSRRVSAHLNRGGGDAGQRSAVLL